MLKFILKKLLFMIPMLLLISIIVFFGLQLTGIDPINFMVSPEMLSANADNVEALRESLGLNDPLIIQYFRWLGNCLRGDLGYSFSGSSISEIIAVRLPYTFELAGWSLLISAIIGIGIGIISAILCIVFDIEPNVLQAFVLCIMASLGAGGAYDLVMTKIKGE